MSGEANADVRLPIGALFAVLGAIIAVYGLMTASDTALYARSQGVNINILWGVVMLVFGVVLFVTAQLAARRGRGTAPGPR